MYARLMHLNVKPDKFQEAVKSYETSIENSKRQPGCRAGILITDPETGKASSVSLWEKRRMLCEVTPAATTRSRWK